MQAGVKILFYTPTLHFEPKSKVVESLSSGNNGIRSLFSTRYVQLSLVVSLFSSFSRARRVAGRKIKRNMAKPIVNHAPIGIRFSPGKKSI